MLSFEIYIYLGIAFLAGAILGYLFCFFTNRNKDKSRMEDELTRAKRELYNQKRMLADFFNTSNTLFEQLEGSYQAYSNHMNEHARKMFPMLGNMYVTTKHEGLGANHIVHEAKEEQNLESLNTKNSAEHSEKPLELNDILGVDSHTESSEQK